MTAKWWSNILSLVAIFALTTAQDVATRNNNSPALNVSSSLEDYKRQVSRQYAEQIEQEYELLNIFRENYKSQVESINYNKELVEAELLETDKKIYSLEFLDDRSKYCAQKYSNILYDISTLRTSIASCINTANNNLNNLLYAAQSTQTTLNNYFVLYNWKNGLIDCARKNSDSYRNETLCVLKLIETTNTYFSNNLRTFVTQMETAKCAANSQMRQAIQCVFKVTNKASGSIGALTRLVGDCNAGAGICAPCANQWNNSTITDETTCPNVINLQPTPETYQNQTIRNPFYGLNRSYDCLLVNFDKLT